jgi:hypothetical protein
MRDKQEQLISVSNGHEQQFDINSRSYLGHFSVISQSFLSHLICNVMAMLNSAYKYQVCLVFLGFLKVLLSNVSYLQVLPDIVGYL